MQNKTIRTVWDAVVVVVVLLACVAFLGRLLITYSDPTRVPLSYVLHKVKEVSVTYFPKGGERLAFTDRNALVPMGQRPELLPLLHGTSTFHAGPPPKVKYDFVIRTTYGFALRLRRRPQVLYSTETGILFCPSVPKDWCVAPKEFQEHMLAIKEEADRGRKTPGSSNGPQR